MYDLISKLFLIYINYIWISFTTTPIIQLIVKGIYFPISRKFSKFYSQKFYSFSKSYYSVLDRRRISYLYYVPSLNLVVKNQLNSHFSKASLSRPLYSSYLIVERSRAYASSTIDNAVMGQLFQSIESYYFLRDNQPFLSQKQARIWHLTLIGHRHSLSVKQSLLYASYFIEDSTSSDFYSLLESSPTMILLL